MGSQCGAGHPTHLKGGVAEPGPAAFAALLRAGGRREGAVAGVGVGLRAGPLLRAVLDVLGLPVQAKPVAACRPHDKWLELEGGWEMKAKISQLS